jgi:hypothetical protein
LALSKPLVLAKCQVKELQGLHGESSIWLSPVCLPSLASDWTSGGSNRFFSRIDKGVPGFTLIEARFA